MLKKLTLLFFLVTLGTFGFSQNPLEKKLSIAIEKKSAELVLADLETVCECKFSYNPNTLPSEIIAKTYEEVTLEHIIKDLLGSNYHPKARGSYIILTPPTKSQNKTSLEIRGEIVDAKSGERLTNVSVYEVNNLSATLTDDEGHYDLTADAENHELVLAISKKNYRDTVIRISDNFSNQISLSLIPETRPLRRSEPESVPFVKRMVGKVVKEHDKNVQLYEERFGQISFVPGFGTNGSLGGKITNKVSLNILAGYANGTKGLELSGILGIDRNEVSGVQIGGVTTLAGGAIKGVQLGGVTSIAKGSVTGVQIGGVTSTTIEQVKGLQLGGVMNTSGLVNGAQIGGVICTNFRELKGVQLSGTINYSKDLQGAQISGTWNHNSGTLQGLQLSGFFNYTKTLKGVQVGIINVANSVEKGFAIGLFNFVKEGFHEIELGTNDVTNYQVSFKSGVRGLYSILSSGITPGSSGLWTYGLGMGSQVINRQRLTFDMGLSYYEIQPLEKFIDPGTSGDTRFDLLLGYKFSEKIAINGGPILHWYRYAQDPGSPNAFLNSFGQNPLVSKGKSNPKNTSILWIGYQFNIRL